MSELKINLEKLSDDTKKELIDICPFKAIIEDNQGLSISAACKMCMICVNKGPKGAVELIESEKEKIDKSLWNGITVYVDHVEGEIHPVTYELIGKARELAKTINHPVQALFVGKGISGKAKEILKYGVDEVYVYDYEELEDFVIEPYTAVFEDFVEKIKPSSVLIGATNVGRSLAPRIAARLKTGLTADCTVLKIKENTDLVQIRPAFGGNIMAQIVTENNRPQFCTVRYKIFDAPEKSSEVAGEIKQMNIEESKLSTRIKVIEIKKKDKSESISDADTIIAVGRGLKSEKDLEIIYELAEILDAKVACTRPLIENGWLDPRVQIGLSGRTVKPKLIITVGISGTVQFSAGMQNSDTIIAINSDPNASIYNIAHYGFVGDLYEVVPMLIDKARSKGNII
jgi:electron transfer flavoprotein alpha subunit